MNRGHRYTEEDRAERQQVRRRVNDQEVSQNAPQEIQEPRTATNAPEQAPEALADPHASDCGFWANEPCDCMFGLDEDTGRRFPEAQPSHWSHHERHSRPEPGCHLCTDPGIGMLGRLRLIAIPESTGGDCRGYDTLLNSTRYLDDPKAYELDHPDRAEYGCYEDACHYWLLRNEVTAPDPNPVDFLIALQNSVKCGTCAECQAEKREGEARANRARAQELSRHSGEEDGF